jgi:hypothetical protein
MITRKKSSMVVDLPKEIKRASCLESTGQTFRWVSGESQQSLPGFLLMNYEFQVSTADLSTTPTVFSCFLNYFSKVS